MLLWRKIKIGVLVALGTTVTLIFLANVWVVVSTQKKVFNDSNLLNGHTIALVLGTSSKLTSGASNPFFENRIKAAAELFHQGKIIHFIVSGDNRTPYYNEPLEMKKALVKLGVPDSVITLDYAGLRTLDSIVRCKEIFGQEKITIITQSFHSYRALFISQFYEMDAIALIAKDAAGETPLRVYIREYFARAKAVLDLYILKTAPRHLGEKEPLSL